MDERRAEPTAPTRRAFVGSLAGKAAYVTPAVLALNLRRAVAQSHSEICLPYGAFCSVDEDCCSFNCKLQVGSGSCKM